jgi:hypothetical protein
MEPAEGVGWFERTGRRPARIVLSNRHHWRHCERYVAGIVAHEVGVLCPDETALRIHAADGALLFADCVIRGRHGELGFVSDWLLGDDPQAVRAGLRAVLARLARVSEPRGCVTNVHQERTNVTHPPRRP